MHLWFFELVEYEHFDCEGVLDYGEHLDGFSQGIHVLVSHSCAMDLYHAYKRPAVSRIAAYQQHIVRHIVRYTVW